MMLAALDNLSFKLGSNTNCLVNSDLGNLRENIPHYHANLSANLKTEGKHENYEMTSAHVRQAKPTCLCHGIHPL
jgi:hypothetical protein